MAGSDQSIDERIAAAFHYCGMIHAGRECGSGGAASRGKRRKAFVAKSLTPTIN
jgi:hypothetical protein